MISVWFNSVSQLVYSSGSGTLSTFTMSPMPSGVCCSNIRIMKEQMNEQPRFTQRRDPPSENRLRTVWPHHCS